MSYLHLKTFISRRISQQRRNIIMLPILFLEIICAKSLYLLWPEFGFVATGGGYVAMRGLVVSQGVSLVRN